VARVTSKFYSLLGLCQKAGKLVSGSMQCEKTIRNGKAQLVIIAGDASEETLSKFTRLSCNYEVPIITAGSKELLGHSLGKVSRTIIVITGKGFKDMLLVNTEQNKSDAGVVTNGEN